MAEKKNLGEGRDSGKGNTILSRNLRKPQENRNWCFTLNNYNNDDIEKFKNIPKCNYVFQEEIGENETKHLQGFIAFDRAKTFTAVKKIDSKAHWEVCRDKKASILYCCKQDTRNGEIFSNFDYESYKVYEKPKLIRQNAYVAADTGREEFEQLIPTLVKEFAINNKDKWYREGQLREDPVLEEMLNEEKNKIEDQEYEDYDPDNDDFWKIEH